MHRISMVRFALLITFAAGCAGSPTSGEKGEVFLVVSGPVGAGTTANARLVNNSDASVEFGWLPCEVRTDRQTPSGWVEIPRPNHACILPSISVSPRGRYWFRFAAPAEAGTFRIRADVSGESVMSGAFTVQ